MFIYYAINSPIVGHFKGDELLGPVRNEMNKTAVIGKAIRIYLILAKRTQRVSRVMIFPTLSARNRFTLGGLSTWPAGGS